ncbi:hypothetical protein [Gemmata massiliana]|nr:hypothetical protein [Gemmata massiliana]
MEAIVDNGEEWIEPMLEFRNLLAETQDPAKKQIYCQTKRRNGRVWEKADGSHIPGPYKFSVHQEFLRQLLEVQNKGQIRAVP